MLCRLTSLSRPALFPVLALLFIFCLTAAPYAEEAPRLTLVAFGDSTTAPRIVQGSQLRVYPDVLQEAFHSAGLNANVVNAGIGGDNTTQGRARFEKDVLAYRPDIVLIQFGLNDCYVDVANGEGAPRVSLVDYQDNLRYFVETLKKRGSQPILMTPNPGMWTADSKARLNKPPYKTDERWGYNVLNAEYAASVREIARDFDVPLIDIYQWYLDYDAVEGQDASTLFLDGIHPGVEGQARTAGMIFQTIGGLPNSTLGKSQGLSETDLFVAGDRGVAIYRIPAMTVTNQGTVIALCDARAGNGDDLPNNIDLVVRKSFDSGHSWTAIETIVDYPGTEGAGDAALLTDRDTGTVWLFYVYGPEGIGWKTSQPGIDGPTLRLHLRYSKDDGATWSEARDLNQDVKDPAWNAVWSSPGRGFQDSTGRLWFPLSRSLDQQYTRLIYSDDHGATWEITPDVGANTNESMVIELADGRLMCNMRSGFEMNQRAIAYSSDRGLTWEGFHHDPNLIEPACQACIIRFGGIEGPLLFSNPASEQRKQMTVRISRDEGASWPMSRVIHEGPTAYSCLVELPDGAIGLLYERGGMSPYEKITFARFPIAFLEAGAAP